MFNWLPNFLSLTRLGLALAFPFLPPSYWLPLIILAGFTEWADGVMARYLGAVTPLGQALDPIADKILFISVLGTLMLLNVVQWWEILLLALRDLAVLSGVFWIFLKQKSHIFASFVPKKSGKWATVCQYGYFLSVIWTKKSEPIFFTLTAVIGAWSAADYIYWFLKSWHSLAKSASAI